jgi:CBS domain-containing protein
MTMLTAGLGTFVTYNPSSIRAEASLSEAARKMDSQGIRHLPVVDDERQPIGILSDLDLAQEILVRSRALLTPLSPLPPDTVASLMVPAPITVELQAAPSEALQIILRHRIHSLPVTDRGRLVGMITSTDFLRELSYGEFPTGRRSVADCMEQHDDATVEPSTTVLEALTAMQLRQIEYLVVARSGIPLGVLSLRDARRAMQMTSSAEDAPPTVQGLLEGVTPTIYKLATLQAAASVMLNQRQKGLAVVARSQKLEGLLTEDNILAAMLADLS